MCLKEEIFMSLRFYNTLTRSVQEFVPLKEGEVSLYICGPTVYNYPHIGNLRTYLFGDLLHRWLLYKGYKVHYIMNLTDVDDKTIRNSMQKGISLGEYTEFYKKAFFEDLKLLNILPAEMYPAATDHIKDMIALIQKLLEKGFAYVTEDGVYFRVSSFKGYGQLANLEKDQLKAGASGRLSADEYTKENISDFALWKKWTPSDGEVKWDAPFGAGRPGWHIECSVMSMKYLGETLDIHAGGVDLIFPHHTNEIAQSEAATGKKFVNYWLHATHLIVDGEKMSKSKGNFYTLQDLINKGFSSRAIRYALFTTHYRKPLNFTFDLIHQSESALKRIDDFILMLRSVGEDENKKGGFSNIFQSTKKKFEDSLDDDLNISEAMSALYELIRISYERKEELTEKVAGKILSLIENMDRVLGFIFVEKKEGLTEEEKKLIEERRQARLNKNFKKADEIRQILLEKGIELRDTKDGVIWTRIK